MTLAPTYTLTVDLATISGLDLPNIPVEVDMVDPRLVYPLGMPAETLYPTQLSATTNAQGVATFKLLPSSLVGKYKVCIGTFCREIDMPDSNARLSEIGMVAPHPGLQDFYVGWASPAQPNNVRSVIATADFDTATDYRGDTVTIPNIVTPGDYLWFARDVYPGHIRFDSLQGRDVVGDFTQQAGTVDHDGSAYVIGVGNNRSGGGIGGHDMFFEDLNP